MQIRAALPGRTDLLSSQRAGIILDSIPAPAAQFPAALAAMQADTEQLRAKLGPIARGEFNTIRPDHRSCVAVDFRARQARSRGNLVRSIILRTKGVSLPRGNRRTGSGAS